MTLRARALRGAAVLTVSQIMGQALAFARNMIITRMLSPDDVGIAATLAITWSLVEMLSDVSIDKLLIQARDGEDSRLQATCQAALVVRGTLLSLLLVCLAWPMAQLFQLPDAVWAFRCMAMAPLLRGFVHLDMTRFQRELRFVPSAVSELVPQLVGFGVVFPLASWLHDFRAVLFCTLIQGLVYLMATHLMASRGYRWAWDAGTVRRIAKFGWPLMINGALVFAVGQGDQMAIGARYPKPDLALWSNAMLLASAPLLILGKVAVSMALPILAKCRDDRALFDSRYELCMQGLAWVAAVVAVPLILGGGAIMALAFGEHYAAGGAFIGVLAAAQACRACRLGVNAAAMSCGDTKNPAITNFARVIGVGIAVVLAARHAPLLQIAGAALVGEVLSLSSGIWRLSALRICGVASSLRATLPLGAAIAAAFALCSLASQAGSVAQQILVSALGVLGISACLLLAFPKLWREVATLVRSLHSVLPHVR